MPVSLRNQSGWIRFKFFYRRDRCLRPIGPRAYAPVGERREKRCFCCCCKMKTDCLRLTNPQGMNSIIIFVHGRARWERREKLKQVNVLPSQSELQKACGQKIKRDEFLFYFVLFRPRWNRLRCSIEISPQYDSSYLRGRQGRRGRHFTG